MFVTELSDIVMGPFTRIVRKHINDKVHVCDANSNLYFDLSYSYTNYYSYGWIISHMTTCDAHSDEPMGNDQLSHGAF